MRTNILYLSMVSGLGAVLALVIPAGINPSTNDMTREVSRSVLQLDLSTLQDRYGVGSGQKDDAIQASGSADKPKINRDMTVEALVSAFGEPILKSEDGARWSYSDKVVLVSGERVSGWIDHKTNSNAATTAYVQRNAVAVKSEARTPIFAGRILNPFSTRSATAAVRNIDAGYDYYRLTTRDRLRSARYNVRRGNFRTSTQPAWLRGFGASLDRSDLQDNDSGVYQTGRANYRFVDYSRSGR